MKKKMKALEMQKVLENVGQILTAGLIVGMGLSAVSAAVTFAMYGI